MTWAAFGNILKIFSLPLVSGQRGHRLSGRRIGSGSGADRPDASRRRLLGVVGFAVRRAVLDGERAAGLGQSPSSASWSACTCSSGSSRPLGFALIVILFVYLFTGEPDRPTYGTWAPAKKPAQPRLQGAGRTGKPPDASGRVARWSIPTRTRMRRLASSTRSFRCRSSTSATAWLTSLPRPGEGGWIDQRTLTEGA